MVRMQRGLTVREILVWADANREATGRWPTQFTGPITGTRFETWAAINRALQLGRRGLPGGRSLAQLLTQERGVRNKQRLPRLTIEQVLAWADGYHRRTGAWPNARSGAVPESAGDTWQAIDRALIGGYRGFPGGSSLAQLLVQQRSARHRFQLPSLTEDQILQWADLHFQSTGAWPRYSSGPIAGAEGETWSTVDRALSEGRRGLPGGSSLAFLLAERRGVDNRWTRPNHSVDRILTWADAFHARAGRWPTPYSGPVAEAPDEDWRGLDTALRRGLRGLPGGSSLARLLAAERGARNRASVPPLRPKQILAWAEAYRRRTGRWPTAKSGPIPEALGETWRRMESALLQGLRGLRGGSSLAQLLSAHRGKRNPKSLPPLSKKQILRWADAYRERTGTWPTPTSGPIPEAPGENWHAVDVALALGRRGLPGSSSLHRLLVQKRRLQPGPAGGKP